MSAQPRIGSFSVGVLAFAACLGGIAATATAQSPAQFYQGKNINIIIGVPPGGGYDRYARLVGRHMGRHVPGHPHFIPRNMPGGAELIAPNYVANIAPKDGTEIAAVTRTVPLEPLYGNKAAKFDARKLNWLGSSNREIGLFVAWHTAPDKTLASVFKKQLIVGVTPPGSDTATYANVLKYMFGAKLKIVGGYRGSRGILLAMQRGEVQAIPNISWSNITHHRDWLTGHKINILVQNGLAKLPELPDVPVLISLAKTDEQRSILELLLAPTNFGRPYFLAAGVPADRVAALRTAFMATMADKGFLADAKKLRTAINPVSGEELQKNISRIYAFPHSIVEKANAIRLKSGG